MLLPWPCPSLHVTHPLPKKLCCGALLAIAPGVQAAAYAPAPELRLSQDLLQHAPALALALRVPAAARAGASACAQGAPPRLATGAGARLEGRHLVKRVLAHALALLAGLLGLGGLGRRLGGLRGSLLARAAHGLLRAPQPRALLVQHDLRTLHAALRLRAQRRPRSVRPNGCGAAQPSQGGCAGRQPVRDLRDLRVGLTACYARTTPEQDRW